MLFKFETLDHPATNMGPPGPTNNQQPWPPKPHPAHSTTVSLGQAQSLSWSTLPSTSPPPLPRPRSSFKHLFAFTPPAHIPLLLLSFLTSALVAAGRTAYAIFLGSIFQLVADFGAGLLAPADFLVHISRWCLRLCVLGVGIWVASTADVGLWVVGGELRARAAREGAFAALMSRSVGWFETRAQGVAGLVAGVQG